MFYLCMSKEILDKAKGLLQKAQHEEAIRLLLKHGIDEDSAVSLASARFQKIKGEELDGIKENSESTVELNKITKKLLTFIDEQLTKLQLISPENAATSATSSPSSHIDNKQEDMQRHPHNFDIENSYDELLNIKNHLSDFVKNADEWKISDLNDCKAALDSCRNVQEALRELEKSTKSREDDFPQSQIESAIERADSHEQELMRAYREHGITRGINNKIPYITRNLEKIIGYIDEKLQLAGSLRNQQAQDN